MSKTYEFLKQCGTFFLTTINDSVPAARPFGGVMEYEDELYISTANTKEVYSQMIANPFIQIVAIKPGTRDWIIISGKAVEVNDLKIKQAMFDACPVLLKRFSTSECDNFALFKISEMESLLYSNLGITLLK